jgi:hypothetical protein
LVYFSRFGILYEEKSGNPRHVVSCQAKPSVGPFLAKSKSNQKNGLRLNADDPLMNINDARDDEAIFDTLQLTAPCLMTKWTIHVHMYTGRFVTMQPR